MACPAIIPAKTTTRRLARLLGTKEEDVLSLGAAVVVAIAFFLDLRLIQFQICAARIMRGAREANNNNRTPRCLGQGVGREWLVLSGRPARRSLQAARTDRQKKRR